MINPNFCCSEESSEKRVKKCIENDLIDKKFGFDRIKDVTEKVGFLVNMHVVSKLLPLAYSLPAI